MNRKTAMAEYLAAIFYLGPSLVFAESKVEDFFSMSPAELADTTVTIATGTPKHLFEAAAVTSVITAEQIKTMGATELHEILETVPGVHASLQASTGDYNYSMRGMRNATNSQVLMLLNGTRMSVPYLGTTITGMELPVQAIQKVEVIRGPGSALYGADAFAGVINIITKKAADINGTIIGGRVGDHDSQSGWGQQSAHWAGWDMAASLQYQNTGGDGGRIINNDNQSNLDKIFQTDASRAPGAMNTNYRTLNGHLNLQRKHWDIGFWAFNQEGGSRAGTALALDPKGNINGEQYMGDIRFSSEDWFTDWEWLMHASLVHSDFLAPVQVFPDNTRVTIDANGNILPKSAAVGSRLFSKGINNEIGRTETIPAIEISSIYKGLPDHLLRLSAGFRYEQLTASDLRNFGRGVINASSPAIIGGTLTDVSNTPYAYIADKHRSIWSFVAQDEWQIADAWQLTAGLRYDDYSDFGGTVNPRAALIWNIDSKLTTKWLYGQAFRAPGFAEQGAQNNPVRLGNPHLDPETVQTYEWAFDYRPISALRTALNLYYYQIEDLIAVVPDPGKSTSTFQNTGNQDGYGTEFEWQWQVNSQWLVQGNYAWQYAWNKQTKHRITGVPAHQVYFAVNWEFTPKWQLQSQLQWVGSRTNPIQENGLLADYQTIDFTLRGKKLLGHLNVAASLRNAFDSQYYEPAASAIGQNLPMPGRSFYIETSVEF